MSIIGVILLPQLLAYLINIASGERSAAIAAAREQKLKEALEKEEVLRKALATTHSIHDELRTACAELARSRVILGVTPLEEPFWQLLSDDVFQADLTEWLMAGGIEEGNAVKGRLLQTLQDTSVCAGTTPEQVHFLKNHYFETLEKMIFSKPMLANWRHQLSLDYLREQVAVLRKLAEEAAGVYSPEKQKEALDQYRDAALEAWDIIDLSNLPEGDIHIAMQQLLLRQLYMPLRIQVEPSQHGEGDDATLAKFEEQREERRRREAGYLGENETASSKEEKGRTPVGERLGATGRLVVLGDPGGGKTTMLRWMATAYLLRDKDQNAFTQLPDTESLPAKSWVPVLIRCRDLGQEDLSRSFKDFLTQHLNKTKLRPKEADIMRAVILDRLARGEALLLVDGLDEISDPRVRARFCKELEQTAARYPDAPIVVTSRIVGYRDMPYRMGSGFEHGVIAELSREDKDLFARRWIDVIDQKQTNDEKNKRFKDLIEALHSSNRIERLTGNPMLLTTLALVKRKVGKLPNKRTKLYAEAVSVLLNWNRESYQTIEEDEALPQLEYLAFEMCRRGVQRLGDDEVLTALENLRIEYPTIHALRRRDPHLFLEHLEKRSSILIKSGAVWQKNHQREKAVWEFRHLTFQEYLAARALIDGNYPDRDKKKSLAEQVAPLAGIIDNSDDDKQVSESWREALRMVVADCKNDDVDDVLLAILNPATEEKVEETERPRALLAALCLADEPNVSQNVAEQVLTRFARIVNPGDGTGSVTTTADRVGIEIGACNWSFLLKKCLVTEFCVRPSSTRWNPGGLWGSIEISGWARSTLKPSEHFQLLEQRLQSQDKIEALSAALAVMEAAYEGKAVKETHLPDLLLAMFVRESPAAQAAAWALLWLNGGFIGMKRTPFWSPTSLEIEELAQTLSHLDVSESQAARYLIHLLGKASGETSFNAIVPQLEALDAAVRDAAIEALIHMKDKRVVTPLLARLDNDDANIRSEVITALGRLGDKLAVPPLLARLDDQDATVRRTAVEALGRLGDKLAVPPLLARLDDQDANVRRAAVEALGRLGDKLAVPPLLARLDDQDANVRRAAVEALGQLGDKLAVPSLLAKLDDQDANVRRAAVEALGRLGDKLAVPSLLAKLNDGDISIAADAASALYKLGQSRTWVALTRFLDSEKPDVRQRVASEYGKQQDSNKRKLLSRDLDGFGPWLDPQELITEERVSAASKKLGMPPEEVRLCYESMAVDLNLKLSWKT